MQPSVIVTLDLLLSTVSDDLDVFEQTSCLQLLAGSVDFTARAADFQKAGPGEKGIYRKDFLLLMDNGGSPIVIRGIVGFPPRPILLKYSLNSNRTHQICRIWLE